MSVEVFEQTQHIWKYLKAKKLTFVMQQKVRFLGNKVHRMFIWETKQSNFIR